MRAIATREVGRERRRRSALGRLFFGVAAALVLAAWGCGSSGSVVGPSGEAALTPNAASVSGTWRGAGDSLRLSWRLTQEGGSVNGTSQVASDSGWSAQEGRVVGQVSGSHFSFNDTHASGSPTTTSCSAELEGTLELNEVAPVEPPGPPYPYNYTNNPPSTPPRKVLSGVVTGSACGKPFSGMVTLFRD
jgi:hypothetical protein